MFMRVMAGVALLFVFSGAAGAEVLDYKKIGPKEMIGRMVKDLAGDDVEVRRSATDELKAFGEKALAKLGVEPDAERSLVLMGDGLAELFWLGKATSRTRAERSMDDLVSALALAARGADKPKANAAQKVLLRYASVLMRNPDHPSSATVLDALKALFKSWEMEEEIVPATEVTAFLSEPTPAKAAPVAAETGESAPAPAQTSEAPAAPPAPTPAQIAAEAGQKEEVIVLAPPQSRQKPAEASVPAAQAEPAAPTSKPRVVDSASWKYDDPALKVKTVVAPAQSRAGAAPKPAAAPKAVAAEPAADAKGDGTSILNILLGQLATEEDRKLEAGLKLTAKTSEAVLSNLNHGSDDRSKSIIKRVRALLDHKNPVVKRQAMRTSAALKDNLAAPKLAELLDSGDEPTAKTAHEALKELSGLDLGPTRDGWHKWAAEAR